MTASIEVTAPIAEGSLVVLRNVEFEVDVMAEVVQQMQVLAGHDRFLVIALAGDGDLETWGPDDNLRERVLELLEESQPQPQRPTPPPRPGSSAAGWQGGRGQRPTPPPKST